MSVSDAIKERLDIVDVVSGYIGLKKAGRSYSARCPFHTERTPSFFVFPERGVWRCFGACATGGDVFSFVMRIENLDFGQVLRMLAQRTGVPLAQPSTEHQNNPIFQANQEATCFFQASLAGRHGATARAYLEQRRLSQEAISQFGLGFSPLGGAALKEHMSASGYSEELLIRAGLLTSAASGHARDMFRGRLMFPIKDNHGRVVGFGGRVLGTSTPKYLNTPSTALFDKKSLLYGLNLAKEPIKQTDIAVVVEGYMDVIAAHEHGFTNVVASMGTSLTDQQVNLLRSLTQHVVLALDPDTAGQEATLRSLESSWRIFERRMAVRGRRGLTLYERRRDIHSLKIATLPPGKDPDELIRETAQQWNIFVSKAVPFLDYLLNTLVSKFDLATTQGKASAAEHIFPLIAAIEEPFEQDQYFRRLALLLGVSEDMLKASVGRPRPWSRPRPVKAQVTTSPFRTRTAAVEEHTLALLIQNPDLANLANELREEHFQSPENLAVFTIWRNGVRIGTGVSEVDENLQDHLDYLLTKEIPPAERQQRHADFSACLRRLEERLLRNIKAQEELLLSEMGDDADPEYQDRLNQRVKATNERLRLLFSQRKI